MTRSPCPICSPRCRNTPAPSRSSCGLARSLAADRAHWAPLVRYDATTRWYARLRTGPGYEVWLLSWLPGQSSGLHDHGRSSGVLTVLDGTLRERALTARGEAAAPWRRDTSASSPPAMSTRSSTTRWSPPSACTSTSRA